MRRRNIGDRSGPGLGISTLRLAIYVTITLSAAAAAFPTVRAYFEEETISSQPSSLFAAYVDRPELVSGVGMAIDVPRDSPDGEIDMFSGNYLGGRLEITFDRYDSVDPHTVQATLLFVGPIVDLLTDCHTHRNDPALNQSAKASPFAIRPWADLDTNVQFMSTLPDMPTPPTEIAAVEIEALSGEMTNFYCSFSGPGFASSASSETYIRSPVLRLGWPAAVTEEFNLFGWGQPSENAPPETSLGFSVNVPRLPSESLRNSNGQPTEDVFGQLNWSSGVDFTDPVGNVTGGSFMTVGLDAPTLTATEMPPVLATLIDHAVEKALQRNLFMAAVMLGLVGAGLFATVDHLFQAKPNGGQIATSSSLGQRQERSTNALGVVAIAVLLKLVLRPRSTRRKRMGFGSEEKDEA